MPLLKDDRHTEPDENNHSNSNPEHACHLAFSCASVVQICTSDYWRSRIPSRSNIGSSCSGSYARRV